ncbi:hemolysin type calcium-binding protein [Pacificibacter maritimus]|uniref:Hemolysin type calcium-binding protein n=1 Tax=Pacificibacter maritimus TaxID=762213 RepID=A0A3N4UQI7_9RHOB|nr:calcium-binding protein [Pacificibacter maritimus]RPE70915.1 hemolysin type calcium-binding protein [Pacificibacter maritimus]
MQGHMMDRFNGTYRDDTLTLDGQSASVHGWAGNDVISVLDSAGMSELWGGRGDDTLIASVPGSGQIHMGGGDGNDTIVMDVTNQSGAQGHHVYGGKGADKFVFTNVDQADVPTIGRIDDFDASQDSLWIEDSEIDLYNLPDGVELVMYQDQYWLKIGDNVVYALEGARDGGEERHFSDFPSSVDDLERVTWQDNVNYVPIELYEDEVAELNALYATYAGTAEGTEEDDWIYDDNLDRFAADGDQIVTADSTIRAGAGDDVIDAGKGDDRVYGQDGDDLIAGGQDSDMLFGGRGNDHLWGGSENDQLYGGQGDDTLFGGSGNDVLDGSIGADTLYADRGDDRLYGGGGNDEMHGGTGNDRLIAGRGNDVLHGGEGMDQLYGNRGSDILYGDGGNDRLCGADGNDALFGGNGADILNGGSGDDVLVGGAGRDLMWGGQGQDVFAFGENDLASWGGLSGTRSEKMAELDLVKDFKLGEDRISFEAMEGVKSMQDIKVWATKEDENLMYTLQIKDTNERFLIDVEDDTKWSDMMSEDNFDF